MFSMPEITVTGRKTLSISKTTKRLRRFLGENKPPEAVVDPNNHDDAHQTSSAELVCGIPDETLFQLEQICEALEAKRKRRATMNDLSTAPLPSEQDEAKVMETPKKKSKKRPRDDDGQASVPRTEVKKPAQGDKSELKKKKRRKSAVV